MNPTVGDLGAAGAGTPPVRVLVVDAPAAQRGALIALLDADPALEIVGWAADEASAVRAAARLHPDVVMIALHLPAADAMRTTRRIMQEAPTPMVGVAAGGSHADDGRAAAALAAGVLAVVERPPSGAAGLAATAKLLTTLKSMAEVRVVRRHTTKGAPAVATRRAAASVDPEVVAIGASTGGPQALQVILTRLPATFTLPVLVVQHIAPTFVEGLVDWLGPQCALPMALARHGEELGGPGIHVAPAGHHLVVRGRALALTTDPPLRGHRPSATVLFGSVAAAYGPRGVGVLLSGMGEDGASGLLDLKKAGGTTVAQDEASSVVFGMPGVAIALGAADRVLPPEGIALWLIDVARRRARG